MSFISNIFGSKGNSLPFNFLQVDMHCHLFPGIDDGVENYEESLKVITGLRDLGYKKFIVTPHIMSDFFKNTPEIIHGQVTKLREVIKTNKLEIEIEGAAEYYLDEQFYKLLNEKKLLSFGQNYVLVETNYMSPMQNFKEMMFAMKVAGYKPVLAHPERYMYMYDKDFSKYEEIFELDIFFQLNLSSLVGYYSRDAKVIAEKLIKNKMVHFVGTDIHNSKLLQPLKDAMKTKAFRQLMDLDLLNNTLI